MAERRAVRSSSRRKTPTPQPAATVTSPLAARTRRRGNRSTSRDLDAELPIDAAKSTRRSARQASVHSVVSVTSEGEHDGETGRRAKRRAQKQAVADLTVVEELDTYLEFDDAPQTPLRSEIPVSIPHDSPGAVSEMSGTTAISSFSEVQAELLEARLIQHHLPMLHQATCKFLDHLVPGEEGDADISERIHSDSRRIDYMQMPDSAFVQDYNILENILAPHLSHFLGDQQQYISIRAVHGALFGRNRDGAASQTGLDLVLYQANLVIFAKDMIHTDRGDKKVWDTIRALQNSFPAHFLSGISRDEDDSVSPVGGSMLLQETFELGLDLRTQLAIIYLEHMAHTDEFDPDEIIQDVFLREENDGSHVVQGWAVSALGAGDSSLPQPFDDEVIERCREIRRYFPSDDESLERGEADLEGLGQAFPWRNLILRLLSWIRARKIEVRTALASNGGIGAIEKRVEIEMQNPNPTAERAVMPRVSPRKKRTSFGRNRRRSDRRFDPSVKLDPRVINKLKEKERSSGGPVLDQDQSQLQAEAEARAMPQAPPAVEAEEVEREPMSLIAQEDEVEREPTPLIAQEEEEWETLEDPQQTAAAIEEPIEEAPGPSQPPRSTSEILNLLKQPKKTGKENRMVTDIFARQKDAVRLKFGDGFDGSSQPVAGPSRIEKRPQPSPSKKRARPSEDDSEDDEAFETTSRTARVQEQREKAKAKRVRIDPASSSAPTNHQPRRRNEDVDLAPIEPETSHSETEAPDMTEEAPPPSTYDHRRKLARANIAPKPRKAKTAWTLQQEEALVEYVGEFGTRYSDILKHDVSEAGHGLLGDRTQVNLKDKVRNMAIVMIKSGTGLMPGFDHVIKRDSVHGQRLLDDGFDW
ncbi:hypothetical protein CC80DRAFT_312403 [Byssothecium circinans]|uniref:Myb-like domain-containing protein n=1 Tax=Byssothecium circinans TaxID=147558 RepID=A0A6A5U6D8_9PLEO|nr:hypothetical protein CC80DRAFT_312403 [Byssothecium circinans]